MGRVALIVAFVSLVFFSVAIHHIFFFIPSLTKSCSMTYSRPNYVEIPFAPVNDTRASHRWGFKYKLFRYFNYGERKNHGDEFIETYANPVLFVPGHLGSYKQVRSFGSQAHFAAYERLINSRKAEKSNSSGQRAAAKALVFYALDFSEEWSAINGEVLWDQAEAVTAAVASIRALHSFAPVAVLGHSMGGVVAMGAISQSAIRTVDVENSGPSDGRVNLGPEAISIVVTVAAPLARPRVALDAATLEFYDMLHYGWRCGPLSGVNSTYSHSETGGGLVAQESQACAGAGVGRIFSAQSVSLVTLSAGFRDGIVWSADTSASAAGLGNPKYTFAALTDAIPGRPLRGSELASAESRGLCASGIASDATRQTVPEDERVYSAGFFAGRLCPDGKLIGFDRKNGLGSCHLSSLWCGEVISPLVAALENALELENNCSGCDEGEGKAMLNTSIWRWIRDPDLRISALRSILVPGAAATISVAETQLLLRHQELDVLRGFREDEYLASNLSSNDDWDYVGLFRNRESFGFEALWSAVVRLTRSSGWYFSRVLLQESGGGASLLVAMLAVAGACVSTLVRGAQLDQISHDGSDNYCPRRVLAARTSEWLSLPFRLLRRVCNFIFLSCSASATSIGLFALLAVVSINNGVLTPLLSYGSSVNEGWIEQFLQFIFGVFLMLRVGLAAMLDSAGVMKAISLALRTGDWTAGFCTFFDLIIIILTALGLQIILAYSVELWARLFANLSMSATCRSRELAATRAPRLWRRAAAVARIWPWSPDESCGALLFPAAVSSGWPSSIALTPSLALSVAMRDALHGEPSASGSSGGSGNRSKNTSLLSTSCVERKRDDTTGGHFNVFLWFFASFWVLSYLATHVRRFKCSCSTSSVSACALSPEVAASWLLFRLYPFGAWQSHELATNALCSLSDSELTVWVALSFPSVGWSFAFLILLGILALVGLLLSFVLSPSRGHASHSSYQKFLLLLYLPSIFFWLGPALQAIKILSAPSVYPSDAANHRQALAFLLLLPPLLHCIAARGTFLRSPFSVLNGDSARWLCMRDYRSRIALSVEKQNDDQVGLVEASKSHAAFAAANLSKAECAFAVASQERAEASAWRSKMSACVGMRSLHGLCVVCCHAGEDAPDGSEFCEEEKFGQIQFRIVLCGKVSAETVCTCELCSCTCLWCGGGCFGRPALLEPFDALVAAVDAARTLSIEAERIVKLATISAEIFEIMPNRDSATMVNEEGTRPGRSGPKYFYSMTRGKTELYWYQLFYFWLSLLGPLLLAFGLQSPMCIRYLMAVTGMLFFAVHIWQRRKEFEHYPGALIRVSSALDQEQKIRSFLKSKALERPLSSLADSGLLLEEADK